jgi:hypothetical protein
LHHLQTVAEIAEIHPATLSAKFANKKRRIGQCLQMDIQQFHHLQYPN